MAAVADHSSVPTVVGQIVINAYDDSPVPVTGRIIAQVSGDSVTVAWGDEQYSATPRVSTEWYDELCPVRQHKTSTP